MSNIHIQNQCRRKGVQFSDHLQSQAFKGRSIVLSASDHQALVIKAIQILSVVSETSSNEKKNHLL